jgi:hypothetical protein
MTKRKTRRFDEGGDTNQGIRDAITSMDTSGANVSGQYSSPESQATSEAPQTFSEAFKAARASGDKTFTFNGKSYTTALKGDTKPASKPAALTKSSPDSDTTPVKSAAPKAESAYDRMNRQNREQGRDFDSLVKKLKDRIVGAASRSDNSDFKPSPRGKIDTSNLDKNTLLRKQGMKKGGVTKTASTRADGIAKRGKTRGVMR